MKSDRIDWAIFKWVFVFSMLNSFGVWFLFGTNRYVVSAIALFFGVLLSLCNRHLFALSKENVLWFCFFLLASLLTTLHSNVNGILGVVICSSPIFFIFTLNGNYKYLFINFFSKIIAWLLLVSLIAWVLYLLGAPLPSYVIKYNNDQYTFKNYYFFIVRIDGFISYLIPRFQSIFIEPGYFGCLLSILLFINPYKTNKFNYLVFLSSLIFSFSLAGYIIFFTTSIAMAIKRSHHKFGVFIFVFCCISLFYLFATKYKSGQNMINQSIVERLRFDEDKNKISGYNRLSNDTADYFSYFITSRYVLFGNPHYSFDDNDVSASRFIIQNGIIGLLSYFLYLLFPLLCFGKKYDKYDLLVYIALFIMIFFQTIYYIFSMMYVALFVCGAFSLRINRKKYISTYECQK